MYSPSLLPPQVAALNRSRGWNSALVMAEDAGGLLRSGQPERRRIVVVDRLAGRYRGVRVEAGGRRLRGQQVGEALVGLAAGKPQAGGENAKHAGQSKTHHTTFENLIPEPTAG